MIDAGEGALSTMNNGQTPEAFVAGYSLSMRDQIDFAWNGKHPPEFRDDNESFRWQVSTTA